MKKKILPIILSVIAIIIMSILVVNVYKGYKAEEKGTITIKLLDKDKKEITKKTIEFKENDTFEELLKSNFEIKMENTMLVKIDSLYAPNTAEEFIKIYINCEASKQGVKTLKFKDKDEIIFIIEKTIPGASLTSDLC